MKLRFPLCICLCLSICLTPRGIFESFDAYEIIFLSVSASSSTN
jgi:hypothetical protein